MLQYHLYMERIGGGRKRGEDGREERMEERGGRKREEGMRKGETYTRSTRAEREGGTAVQDRILLHNCEAFSSVFVGNYLCVFGIIIPL